MKNRIKNSIPYVMIALILITISCKKPYIPTHIKPVTGFLVVEGVINTGNDSTRFKLSRTVNLDSSTTAPITGATVTIEGSDNTSYPLIGNAAGIYTSAPLNLDNSQQYRMHIVTSQGADYMSDYVSPKITPPIDSLHSIAKPDGLQINLDSHDETNNTRYYRWDFVETWEFHAEYNSQWISNGDTVIQRTQNQQIYFCYTSASSNSVLIGSSAKLTKDVISSAPITFVPSSSEKVEVEYSILVYQYALTNDAYTFWDNLKKNTEELGSIFDAQPTDLTGNIHSTTNPGEHVIGYISASTVQSKRIFVKSDGFLPTWRTIYPYNCEADSILFKKIEDQTVINEENIAFNYNKGGGSFIPITGIYDAYSNLLGHTGSDPICVDCTIRGSIKPPSFWK